MGDQANVNSEVILKQLGGCGCFQVLMCIFLGIAELPTMISYLIMTFGNYNPGWRCLDNGTTIVSLGNDTATTQNLGNNATSLYNQTSFLGESDSLVYIHTCEGFHSCQHVEFSPEVNTIVTQWGLACESSWTISTMLSLQMAGNLVGTLVVGYFGDRFGRKYPYLISLATVAVLNLLSFFSVNWQMFAVLIFFIGFCCSFMVLSKVMANEYVPEKWRGRINSSPSWTVNAILFAVLAMLTRDWKMLRLISAILAVVFVVGLAWLPDSLRWLSVRGKEKAVYAAVKKIAKVNKTKVPEKESIDLLMRMNTMDEKKKASTKTYTILTLFRKGYFWSTVITGYIFFVVDMTYFTMNFGVSTMPGNIFINLLVFSATDFPANILGFAIANMFNRKPLVFAFMLSGALCLFGVVAMDLTTTGTVREFGVLGLVMLAKICIFVGWIILTTLAFELYPTVVRSNVTSFSFLCSNLGSVLAPYLIPSEPKWFYLCYSIMACANLACAGLVFFLPETKGKPMKDRYDEDDDDDDVEDGGDENKDKDDINDYNKVVDVVGDDDNGDNEDANYHQRRNLINNDEKRGINGVV